MTNLLTYLPLLLQGAGITIAAWFLAGALSLCLGICIGIMICRSLASAQLTSVVRIYTFIAKGIPAYVQILIAYFVLPAALGITIPSFIAATCALAFCSSGYVTEIVRSGINALPRGQWDACLALGYPLRATLTRIILPQTVRNILPTLFGELEQLLKSTSLLATIGVMELTRAGMNIISRELNPLPVYLAIACIYLLFSALLQLIIIYTERRMQYGAR
jgi:His/Glu/Gln/Arg/opine family amino acid ABC transporter permease subunit